MLPPARAMRQAIHEIELRAAGTAAALEGAVRITSSVVVGTEHLPPIIARIRREEPRIELELHVSDETSNLHFREADIAVRLYRPTQLDFVTQHLGDLRFAAFAAKSYVERRGLPRRPEDLLAHDVVGMDRETAILEGFRQAGFPVEREWFKVRADNPTAYWQLVRAGSGIGFGQVLVGARDPELVEIPLGLDLPKLPVWLTAHEAVRHAPRVARVWELLAEELREVLAS
jgi:DNA-binding transcriptional LysR family regulator